MKTAYDIIIKPVITEQSMEATEEKKYVFQVAIDANKVEIKKAAFRLCLFVYAVECGNSNVSSRRGIRLKRFDRHIALLSLQID